MKVRIALWLALLLFFALITWVLLTQKSDKSTQPALAARVPEVVAVPVNEQQIQQNIEAIGTTASWEAVEIRATVSDFIEAIHFRDGQLVRKGDLLLTLARREEQARLLEARAVLDEQVREARRIESMVAAKLLPANQLDERITQREIARARLEVAESAVADRVIRAPFSGMLGLRRVSPGALVKPEDVITTLDDIASLRLDFPVPSLRLAELKAGMQLTAITPAIRDRAFRAEVVSIDSRVNPVDRSVMVRARIDNSGLHLRPGMLLNVKVASAPRAALVIPEEAVIHYQREHYVFRIDTANGNRLQRRDVETGVRAPGTVEIVSGLVAGDLVVTEGATSARAGEQVRLRQTPADSGTKP